MLTFSQLKMNRVEISLYDVVKSTGEVKDTFKFQYGGRRYDRLSLSEKIRAGMEVSELMKRLTGTTGKAPVVMPATETIAALRARYAGTPVTVTGDIVVAGTVTTSDRAENFYRTLCICDAEAGLEVMAGIDHLHNDLPIGSRVTLSLRGLTVAQSRGVLQAGRPPAAGSGYATDYIGSRAALGVVRVRSGEALAAPSPAPAAPAKADFAARRAVNFAVRQKGKLIGEVVLYRPDFRGGFEQGCRIAPAYAGHGYGTEAFAAAADWALYHLGLARVVAKCFKENAASHKMLASCMRPSGEDETYFYFEKAV